MRVEVKVVRNSLKRSQRKMQKLQRKIKNPSTVHRAISIWLLRWVNNNFKTEGGKFGGWPPFKYGGRIKKGMRDALGRWVVDKDAKLLQDTGRLRASYNPFHSRKTAGVGSNLPYSLTHQLGLPHRNLPAREMIPRNNDPEVVENVMKIYNWHIKRAQQ